MTTHPGAPVRERTAGVIRVAVLGPVRVEGRDGALGELPGERMRVLVATLALAAPSSVSSDALIVELWGDAPPRNARAALQTLVSRLRAIASDELIRSTTSGYALGAAPETVDVVLARRLSSDSARMLAEGDAHAALTDATRARGLRVGDPGADLAGHAVAETLAQEADAIDSALVRTVVAARLALGRFDEALADATRLATVNPLDENAQLTVMSALEGSGRTAEALQLFARYRELLREELGTSPGRPILELNTRLLRENAEDAHDAEPSSLPRRTAIGLRAAPNPLLGRDDDLRAVEELSARSRVTTILGAGGLGKTRLAHELAHRAATSRTGPPAVIVVELASVRDGDDVVLAFGTALGLTEASAPRRLGERPHLPSVRARVLGVLAERETLLIIDNCEHVVDAVADWVSELVSATTSLVIVTTSRAPLAITSESVYPLDPLPSASTGSAAFELFAARARAARPSVALPEEAVIRLCRRLDGLPLAIELAAARVRSMSVEEIERRLQNRFALLSNGDRSAPQRHRTLFAVIDWSWNLLSDDERRVLRRLSLFPDGFGADAARAVTVDADAAADSARPAGRPRDAAVRPDVTDELEALVNQSLLSAGDDANGSIRYRMLETVREFGDMALVDAGDDVDVRARMWRWAATFALRALDAVDGPSQVPTFRLVTIEQDNLITILRDALDAQEHAATAGSADRRAQETITAVFALLSFYWSIRSAHTEVFAFGPRVVRALHGFDPGPELVDALALLYSLTAVTTIFGRSRAGFPAVSGLRRLLAHNTVRNERGRWIAGLVSSLGDEERMLESLAEARTSRDLATSTWAHIMTSQLDENNGRIEEALASATRGHELASRLDDTWSMAMSASSIGQLHSQSARPELAIEWTERASAGLRALQADSDVQQLDWTVAINLIGGERREEARTIFRRFVENPVAIDDRSPVAIGYAGLAELALADGDLAGYERDYRAALRAFVRPAERASPWYSLLGSAVLAGHALHGVFTVDETTRLARSLRARVLAQMRVRPGFTDRPAMATAVVGVGVWLSTAGAPGMSVADGDERLDLALRLLAVGARLHARQDAPSLLLEPQFDRLAETLGRSRVDATRAGFEELGLDGCEAAVQELLRDALLHHPR